MSKITALFSGQGSQYPGMGAQLSSGLECAREIYECAGDILGYDLLKVCENEEKLSLTIFAQPAIFTLGVAAFTAAKERIESFNPAGVAGHSLGEYAALYCAGAYSLEDGFRIIKARARAMDEVKGAPSAMYAIMGVSAEEISEACEKAEGFVEPVNFNQPAQTVISGEEKPAAQAAGLLEDRGAKVVRLNVSGAFHTKLMEEAAKRLKEEISGIAFSPLQLAFYSNLTGRTLEVDDYPEYFAKHMVSPVLFTKQMQSISADGVDVCVEFGPKRTVASLAKKNVKTMRVYGVEDMASLEKLKEELDI